MGLNSLPRAAALTVAAIVVFAVFAAAVAHWVWR